MTAAQSIRQAALTWKMGALNYEAMDILWAYSFGEETLISRMTHDFQWRTFMLLVAEELDGGGGRYEEMIYRQVDSIFRSLNMM